MLDSFVKNNICALASDLLLLADTDDMFYFDLVCDRKDHMLEILSESWNDFNHFAFVEGPTLKEQQVGVIVYCELLQQCGWTWEDIAGTKLITEGVSKDMTWSYGILEALDFYLEHSVESEAKAIQLVQHFAQCKNPDTRKRAIEMLTSLRLPTTTSVYLN